MHSSWQCSLLLLPTPSELIGLKDFSFGHRPRQVVENLGAAIQVIPVSYSHGHLYGVPEVVPADLATLARSHNFHGQFKKFLRLTFFFATYPRAFSFSTVTSDLFISLFLSVMVFNYRNLTIHYQLAKSR